MDASPAVVVFIKAPVPRTVKTRLVPALSFTQAAALAESFAQDAIQWITRLGREGGWRVWIAYQPHPQWPTPAWVGQPLPWFPQQGQHLGERLKTAFDQVFQQGDRPVVVMATDSPTLPPRYLSEAVQLLQHQQPEVVLGPSDDGGYYLIGLQRLQPQLFEEIPWSTPLVFEATRTRVEHQRLPMSVLPPWFDVDAPQDLVRLAESFRVPSARAQAPHTARLLTTWGYLTTHLTSLDEQPAKLIR
ncbi:MAG: TIGR04282 family arsenosugar biosynthesis glycosyltransferase [Elusimicrobia bacterium]|nr:TIGR04282 family arsenosugar biosynthesis glycosyltransferase [Elusimicrobiota bacterium]